ncbi:MAG: GGDEF domain-containing protein [Pseudomonadota bacterium]
MPRQGHCGRRLLIHMSLMLRFLESLLPSGMRSNPADLMRSYVLVALTLFNIGSAVLALIVINWGLDLEHNTWIAVALNGACVLVYSGILWLLGKTQNHRLCSNLLLIAISMIIFTGVQITGGFMQSPILQVAVQIPITAFLLLGLREGMYWLLIASLICAASYASSVMGIGSIQMLQNQEVIDGMHTVLLFLMLLIIGGALVVYEIINGMLNRALSAEKDRFEHRASHDDLTGIANRFEFFRRLRTGLEEARDREHKVGVVYIDLDGFKPINDEHGHHVGDETLKAIAQRLTGILRLSDTTARLGGDEFALILPGIRVPEDIDAIMPKILQAIREPIQVENQELVVRGSCGVSIFPLHSQDYDELCRYADTAMYRAKEQRDAYRVFEKTMSQTA